MDNVKSKEHMKRVDMNKKFNILMKEQYYDDNIKMQKDIQKGLNRAIS
jgi:hypothetical protein